LNAKTGAGRFDEEESYEPATQAALTNSKQKQTIRTLALTLGRKMQFQAQNVFEFRTLSRRLDRGLLLGSQPIDHSKRKPEFSIHPTILDFSPFSMTI